MPIPKPGDKPRRKPGDKPEPAKPGDEEPPEPAGEPGARAARARVRPCIAPPSRPCPRSSRSTSRRSGATPTTTSTSCTATACGRRGTPGRPRSADGPVDARRRRRRPAAGSASMLTDDGGRRSSCPAARSKWTAGEELGGLAAARRAAAACCRPCTSGGGWPSEGLGKFGDVYYLRHGPAGRAATSRSTCWSACTGRRVPVLLRSGRGPAAGGGDVPRRGRRPVRGLLLRLPRGRTAARLPRRIEVRYGDEPFAAFKFDDSSGKLEKQPQSGCGDIAICTQSAGNDGPRPRAACTTSRR